MRAVRRDAWGRGLGDSQSLRITLIGNSCDYVVVMNGRARTLVGEDTALTSTTEVVVENVYRLGLIPSLQANVRTLDVAAVHHPGFAIMSCHVKDGQRALTEMEVNGRSRLLVAVSDHRRIGMSDHGGEIVQSTTVADPRTG